jgi:regulator of replication initiation timing
MGLAEEGKIIIEKEKSWILAHERILIIFAILIAVVFLGNAWLNHEEKVASEKNVAAQQVLQEQVNINTNIAAQLKDEVKAYKETLATLTAQNAALVQSIAQRQVAVQKQQKIDQTLPLPDLGKRLGELAGIKTPEVKPTDTGLEITKAGSVAITQLLETLPQLQQDVKALQQEVGNKDIQIASLTSLVNSLNTQVDGLKKELVDKDKACAAQINEVKAKARKSKIRYFLTGFGIGVGIATYLLH